MVAGSHCIITGVPRQALLGEIEGVLLPVCMQRILMIEVVDTQALIEFESERDADACVGECQLHECTVQVERHDGTSLTPSRVPFKKVKTESKADKEKRLNRVGLSYRCGRCGMPKKGHVCTMTDEEAAEIKANGGVPLGQTNGTPASVPNTSTPAVSPPVAPGSGANGATSEEKKDEGWDLNSDSIFKEMKSVITKSSKEVKKGEKEGKRGGKKADEKEKDEPKKGGRKAREEPAAEEPAAKAPRNRRKSAGKNKEMPPPDGKGALYAEIDLALHRPPSVITPEESDLEARTRQGVTPGALTGGSAAAISPGALMYTLLGTPTPGVAAALPTPGGSLLSPGTLNELGNMLQATAHPAARK